MDLETLAVIPARYASTRLPGKPLIPLAGVPLILRVYRGVRRCTSVDRIIVATDDERIASVVRSDGGEAMMTPADLPSGGDRVAWVANRVPSRFVLNVQGDDPLVGPDMVDPLIGALREEPGTTLAVLAKRIEREEEIDMTSIVKVVFALNGRALYFSRSRIPFPRVAENTRWFKHIGPYGWRRDALLKFAGWAPTPLETTESLEMLRVLEHGGFIRCVQVQRDTIEVDTPDDVRAVETFLASHPNGENR